MAVLLTDYKPERVLQFKAAEAAPGHGRIGCVISMLKTAANSRTAVFDEHACGCPGGATYTALRRGEVQVLMALAKGLNREPA